MTKKAVIRAVMAELENMPCSGIGPDGPTVDELDDYVEKHYAPMDDDAVYHTTQKCWRMLESLLKEHSSELSLDPKSV